MFKKILLFLACVSLSQALFASHIAGGEITYKRLGANQYRFSLNLYVDCEGIDLDHFQSLNLVSSCGASTTLDLALSNPSGTEILHLCSDEAGNTICNGGVHPGMLAYYFTGEINLASCDSWLISWSDCCRNEAVVNLLDPGSNGHYIETSLNNATTIGNDSPVFVNEPIPSTCVNQALNYSFRVNETDGHSIRYKLIDAKSETGVPLDYIAGFSANNPINGLTLDSLTGLANFTPIMVGNYVVVVLVEEFDQNGILIGSIMRDIQFVVQNCSNEIPTSTDGVISNLSSNATLIDSYAFSICNGSTFSFTTTFGDLNASDSLFLTTNIQEVLPGAIVVVTGINPLAVSITADVISITNTDVLNFEVNIRDNACPIIGRQDFVYRINLKMATLAIGDTTICGTQQAGLKANFGTNFTWSVISGDPMNVGSNFTCNPCAEPFANPSITTVYEVVSDLSTGCVNRDTVTVTVGTDFTSTLTVDVDSSFCSLHKASLLIDNQPADSYTFSWTNASFLDNATIANPQVNMQPAGTYEFIYTTRNASGCVKMDSVTLISHDSGSLFLTGDTLLCFGESTQLINVTSNVYEDNFDGILNSDLWLSVNGAELNTDCGSVSGKALHFNEATRIAETNPINTTTGGSISFDLLIASGLSPCEAADLGENVLLEYSTNGGTNWLTLDTYLTTSFTSFTQVVHTIPVAAMSSSTKFRWTQPSFSGFGSDNWALDNVKITITSNLSAYTGAWYAGGSLITTSDTLNVSPLVETTYHYLMTHNTTSCVIEDSITVHVSSPGSSTSSSSITESVCGSYTAPDGQIYTTSGTYTAVIPNVSGCDSIITINLTVNNPSTSSIALTACGSLLAPDGQVYTASGTYTAIIPNAAGCDSTIILQLTMINSTAANITVSACDSYLAVDGTIFTVSGTYAVTISNAAGCDSTIMINLTLNEPTTSIITENVCGSYTAPDGSIYTSSGTYTALIPNTAGCDSIITINLTVNPAFEASLIEVWTGGEVQAYPVDGDNYEWFRCMGALENLSFSGSVYPDAMFNDMLQVIVSRGACTDTSDCTLLYLEDLDEYLREKIKLYPNPTDGLFHVDLGQIYSKVTIKITDLQGREIKREEAANQQHFEVELNEAAGIYLVHVLFANQELSVIRVVRE